MPRIKALSDDEVLDRALEVLLAKGPHRLTLPGVATVVGLSPSTLIQRFGSKAELLNRVLRRATHHLDQQTKRLPKSGDPRHDLIEWLVGLAAPFRTRSHVASNLTLLSDDLSDGPRRTAAQQHMRAFRRGIATYLRRSNSPTIEAHTAVVEAHWHGLVIQWAMQDTADDIEDWLRRGLGDLLAVLLPQT